VGRERVTTTGTGLEQFSMSDQVVLVTGASRGIGRALALGFAAAGARVAVNYRSHRDEALAVVEQIEAETGRPAIAIGADVCEADAVSEMIASVGNQLGPVDVLICNAGIPGAGLAVDVDIEDWRRVLQVHLDGTFLCARETVRQHMAPRKSGSIVVIGSISGSIRAARIPGGSEYYTAKGGLLMLSRSLALEWVDLGIRVNTLCPGYIETAIFPDDFGPGHPDYDAAIRDTPMRRLGAPEDLVGPALFLASAASGFMTGQAITVDGGYSAW
jgi:NAD(P)-dependent dehydrogenase (short-subunit alcohol dehydrogenase family)